MKVIASVEPLFTRKLDVLEVIEGRNARFDCKVSGTPPPVVTWTHFGKCLFFTIRNCYQLVKHLTQPQTCVCFLLLDNPLVENEDIRILKEGGRHSLVISHVSSEDEGFYTVVAKNTHGEAESSAELYVQEPRPAMSSQM